MPSKSPAQRRLPQSVGKEFAAADKRHAGASPKSRTEQMEKRRKQGLTYREVASEHGVSKSTAHRSVMRQGYAKLGEAK